MIECKNCGCPIVHKQLKDGVRKLHLNGAVSFEGTVSNFPETRCLNCDGNCKKPE